MKKTVGVVIHSMNLIAYVVCVIVRMVGLFLLAPWWRMNFLGFKPNLVQVLVLGLMKMVLVSEVNCLYRVIER